MAEKPDPKPENDRYSEEETARRRDATIKAMIRMKPNPRQKLARRSSKAPGPLSSE